MTSDPLNPEPYEPQVSLRCPECKRAHYDSNYTNCVECNHPL